MKVESHRVPGGGFRLFQDLKKSQNAPTTLPFIPQIEIKKKIGCHLLGSDVNHIEIRRYSNPFLYSAEPCDPRKVTNICHVVWLIDQSFS